jgi:hypothetical protein
VPTVFGGNGVPFRAYMGHDSGSNVLTIWDNELSLMGINATGLSSCVVQISGSLATFPVLVFEMRVLNEGLDRHLVDWHVEKGCVTPYFPGACRLSAASLVGRYFVFDVPPSTDRRLLVAQTKTALYRMI